jgi:hypothetical protein
MKLVCTLFAAVLVTGCGTLENESKEAVAQRRAFKMATENQQQCVERMWREIDAGYTWNGIAINGGGAWPLHQMRREADKESALQVCSIKKR